MRRTFNLGIGLVAVVEESRAKLAVEAVEASGMRAWRLGEVTSAGADDEPRVSYV